MSIFIKNAFPKSWDTTILQTKFCCRKIRVAAFPPPNHTRFATLTFLLCGSTLHHVSPLLCERDPRPFATRTPAGFPGRRMPGAVPRRL